MNVLLHQIRLFFTALQFFTRLPIPRWVGFAPEWLQASAKYFPWVGWLVGMLCAVVFLSSQFLLPIRISVLLAMAAGLLITGAFHEDGLADTADGLGGFVRAEKALVIMKDSRIGTYGAAALIMALLLRWESLAAQGNAFTIAALLISGHAISRLCSVSLMRVMRYVRDDETARAKPMATQLTGSGLAVAVLGAMLATLLALLVGSQSDLVRLPKLGGAFAAGSLVAMMITIWFARMLRRRLGGYTGDTLGAAQQLAETAFYLGALAVTTAA